MLNWKAIEVLDICLGIVGFFAAAFFVVTAVCELTGAPALGWALTLLGLVAALALLVTIRRRMLAAEARGGAPVSTAWGGSLDEYRRRRQS
ncbi:hypothetical protein [Gryllotalpicola ginsengisoli]|uniref:hypothetical protein n=1 Tax=Gryllotalpicola ginsengisoli TaxID=444608 RepID=UPI0003B5ABEF|nr:hypothetical protein [Gryllotalpicola ginsengisoli]